MAALQLGAKCSLELDDTITHVVAGSFKTEKALLARKKGIPVVSPEWLFACGELPCLSACKAELPQLHPSSCVLPASPKDGLCFAAFLWVRVSEERFPAVQDADTAPLALNPQADLEAALKAAGGGRGVQSSAVGMQVGVFLNLPQSS